MIITITGHSGSGKSTLALMLSAKFNLKLIDVDEIVSTMYDDDLMQQTLRNLFGDVAEGENGKIEKRLVSKIVLNNKNLWNALNDITWNYLETKIDKILAECNNEAVIDYKFIPVTKYFASSDYNILVEAKKDKERYKLLSKRDKIDKSIIAKRDSFSPNYKRNEYDFVIVHNYNKDFALLCESVVKQIKEGKEKAD